MYVRRRDVNRSSACVCKAVCCSAIITTLRVCTSKQLKSNRAALGAVVTFEQGNDKCEKEIRSGDGYISQSDLRIHFGLGKAAKVDRVIVRWPSGLVETLQDLSADQYYTIVEGRGIDPKETHGISKVQVVPTH